MHVPKGVLLGVAAVLLVAATVGITLALTGDEDSDAGESASGSTTTATDDEASEAGSESTTAVGDAPFGSGEFARSLKDCMEFAGFEGVYLAPGVTPSGSTTSVSGKAPSGEKLTVHGFETPEDAHDFATLIQSEGANKDLAFAENDQLVIWPGPVTAETLALLGTCFD